MKISEETIARHAAFLGRLAQGLARDGAEAEDLAQEGWLAALMRPPRDEGGIGGWLATVVRRIASRRRRTDERRIAREHLAAQPESQDRPGSRQEALDALVHHLAVLPERSREILFLRWFDELSFREIGKRLDIDAEAARSRHRRALHDLWLRMTEEGGEAAGRAIVSAIVPAAAWAGGGAAGSSATWALKGIAMSMGVKSGIAAAAFGAAVIVVCVARSAAPEADRSGGNIPTDGMTAAFAPANPAPVKEPESPPVVTRPFVAPDAGSAAPSAAPPGIHVTFKGCVADERRFPVAGARVRLSMMGLASQEAVTGDDGRFSFAAFCEGFAARGCILAADAEGARGAVRSLDPVMRSLQPVEDLGKIVLAAASSLRIQMRRVGAPAPGARVSLLGPSGPLGWSVADAEGDVTVDSLPDGDYKARALDQPGELGYLEFKMPRVGGAPAVVELAAAEPLVVRVVEKDGGAAVPGATVSAVLKDFSRIEATTTDEGNARLAGRSPFENVMVSVRAPEHRKADGITIVRAGQNALTIALDRLQPETWVIDAREGEAPADGTELSFRSTGIHAGLIIARIDDGRLVVTGIDGDLFSGILRLPDGRVGAIWKFGQVRRDPAVIFTRPRRLEIQVCDQEKRALAGRYVALSTGANAPATGGKSDEQGVVVFEGLPGIQYRATVFITSKLFDLADGDGRGNLELLELPKRAVELHCVKEGAPRLPPEFSIVPRNARVGPIDEDPAGGILRFELEPQDPGQAPGFELTQPGREHIPFTLSADAVTGPDVFRFEETGGATLEIHVIPPADGHASVLVNRWDPERRDWIDERGWLDRFKRSFKMEGLGPGRYRARDVSGAVSPPVEIAKGAVSAKGTLDLSKAGAVTCRIEDGFGRPVPDASLEWVGETFGLGLPRRLKGKDGVVKLRVPGTDPVRLRAWHPLLRPAKDGGEATLTAPVPELVLLLAPAAGLNFRVDPSQAPPGQPLDVRVFADAGMTQELMRVDLWPKGPGISIGGLDPGVVTLWIRPREHLPRVLRDIPVDFHAADLGLLEFEDGASLEVALRNLPAGLLSRRAVKLQALDGPQHERLGSPTPASTMLFRGLAPGRYRLIVTSSNVTPPDLFYEEEILIQGGMARVLEVSSR